MKNTTARHGHYLAVRLVGTVSARDAVGTSVTVLAGGRSIVRQLLAGDGYHASNEKVLIFGLGPSARVEEVRIRWPSGRVQSFRELPADAEALFIEGSSTPVFLD